MLGRERKGDSVPCRALGPRQREGSTDLRADRQTAYTDAPQGKPSHGMFWACRSSPQFKWRVALVRVGPGFHTHMVSTAHRTPWVSSIFISSEAHDKRIPWSRCFSNFDLDNCCLLRYHTATWEVDTIVSIWPTELREPQVLLKKDFLPGPDPDTCWNPHGHSLPGITIEDTVSHR